MSFWQGNPRSLWQIVETGFLKNLKETPGPALFGVRVKKAASPINVRQLTKRHRQITQRLSTFQNELLERWSGVIEADNSATRELPVLSARLLSWACFEQLGIDDPQDRFLYKYLEACFLKLAKTEPCLLPLGEFDRQSLAASGLYTHHEKLNHLEHVLDHGDECIALWCKTLGDFGTGLLLGLPDGLCRSDRNIDLSLSGRLIDEVDEPHMLLATILREFVGAGSSDCRAHGLLRENRERLTTSMLASSGMTLEDTAEKEPDTPLNHLDVPASDLVRKFLGGGPITTLLMTRVPHEL